MNKLFNIEHQYALYLQRMGLSEQNMHPEQKIQLKRTFMGAWGQLLMLLQNELAELPEEKGVEVLESFTSQLSDYWLSQPEKQN